jgi:hypothetical protein
VWPEFARELYWPSDRRLSAKLVPTFADRGCHVVSVTDPFGRVLGFLDRRHNKTKTKLLGLSPRTTPDEGQSPETQRFRALYTIVRGLWILHLLGVASVFCLERQKQRVPPKHYEFPTNLQGAKCQMSTLLVVISMLASDFRSSVFSIKKTPWP